MKLDRSEFSLEVDEHFESGHLNSELWVPHYLPHWTTPDRSLARFSVENSALHLRIDDTQPAWAPEFGDSYRVSNVQTGVRSAVVGSREGQHRYQDDLVVRSDPGVTRALYTPRSGIVEARVKALADPRVMVALWLVGFEDHPEDSGELCVFEIYGNEATTDTALIGVGVKPHRDPRLAPAFQKVEVALDITEFHTYSVEWTSAVSRFYIDDDLVLESAQGPDYPMQLMLEIVEWPSDEPSSDAYPKTFDVDFVRGWSREA